MGKTARLKTASLLIISLLLVTAQSFARPLRDDVREKLIREGKYDEYLISMKDARARGVDSPSKQPYSKRISLSAGPDTMRAVVLLLEFPDHPADDVDGPFVDPAYFNRLFNYEGMLPASDSAYRSMYEFYKENSYGQFIFIADVYGWYMMDSTYAYYVDSAKGFGEPPHNAQRLARDAARLADPEIDYSLYDRDSDGYVDALILVHSGPGFEETGDVNDIHSHQWIMDSIYHSDDGVRLYGYNMNPEETVVGNGTGGFDYRPIKVGVFCHEFGHTISLPDLYDRNYHSRGIGDWSLMASGNYNGNSAVPAGLDAWCKYRLGWIAPENIAASEISHAIPEIFSTGYAARLWTDGDGYGQEYYLLENRRKKGFDSMLPGEGLLIWHMDESNSDNDQKYDYLVALEQADGGFHLERNQNDGDPADPYPGIDMIREFSETTIPGSFANPYNPDGTLPLDTTYVAVWNISDPDSIMYANLDVNYTRPRYEIVDNSLVEVAGDGDANIEAGETYGLAVRVTNIRADAQDVTLSFSIDNENIVIPDNSMIIGNLPAGDTIGNQLQPLEFMIPGDMDSAITMLQFKISDPSQTDSVFGDLKLTVGNPRILLVDQDGNSYLHIEHFYTDIFDSLQIPYVLYERDNLGTPGSEHLAFPIIIWFVSEGDLSGDDVNFLEACLDQGGKLFLTGQNIAQGLSLGADSLFLKNYLKCTFKENGGQFDLTAYGMEGSVIGADNVKFQFTGSDGAWNQGSVDVLTDIDPSAVISLSYVNDQANPKPAGIEYGGNYRLVFWGFGFEGITSILSYKNTRMEAMQRVLNFLDNLATDAEDDADIGDQLPKEFALNQNYPNPFNPRTLISYDLNRRMDNVTLRIYNLLGQEVSTLVDKPQEAGVYRVEWDGTDDFGRQMASGVYFYRLEAEDKTLTRKMVLLK
jgi:M6 family metalloprotease-like protein